MTEHVVRPIRPASNGDTGKTSGFRIGPSFDDVAVSTSGTVAFTQRQLPGEPGEIVMWNTTLSTDDRVVLDHHGNSPAWSADGRILAYVSERHHDEICIVRDVEAPGSIATVRLGSDAVVASIQWFPQSERILVTVSPTDADGSVSDGALRPEAHGWPEQRRSARTGRRIAIVDVAEEQLLWIDIETVSIWEAAGFADGRIIAILSNDHTESGWYGARLSIIDEGREIPLHTSDWQIAGPVVSPSGSRVAFVEGWASDRGHLAGDLAIADIDSHEITLHTGDTLGLDVVSAQWLDDDHLWVTGWRGFSAAWATIDASNFSRIDGGVVPRALSISRSSTIDSRTALVTAHDDGSQAVEVLDQDRLNDRIHDSVPGSSPEARQSVVHWLAGDGVRIEGILVHGTATPPERQRLIVMVHGGPANLWTDTLSPGARALVLGGYSVLLPNPRGSVGRGQAFATANLGDPGGAELGDLLAGAEACRVKGLVMDAAPGIVGGSYGGYLAACAAVFSTEVAAAVAMFGHPDLLSARLASNNGAFYDRLLGIGADAPGWELAFQRSPAFHVRESTAPTLLLHGDRDACTPLGQSEELFGALLAAGVESQLVVYPGAGHGLRGARTQKDVWGRTIDWFDRHLEEAAAC